MTRRGFTILEMLATLVLASTALLMAAKLAQPVARTIFRASRTQDAFAARMSFEKQLSSDVFTASSLMLDPNGDLEIGRDGRPPIVWTLADSAAWRVEATTDADQRSSANVPAERAWQNVVGPAATFHVVGDARVEITGFGGGSGNLEKQRDETRGFVSQTIELKNWDAK